MGAFDISRMAIVEFENEGAGQNEMIEFETNVVYRGEA
jgi:hypothetical protein